MLVFPATQTPTVGSSACGQRRGCDGNYKEAARREAEANLEKEAARRRGLRVPRELLPHLPTLSTFLRNHTPVTAPVNM